MTNRGFYTNHDLVNGNRRPIIASIDGFASGYMCGGFRRRQLTRIRDVRCTTWARAVYFESRTDDFILNPWRRKTPLPSDDDQPATRSWRVPCRSRVVVGWPAGRRCTLLSQLTRLPFTSARGGLRERERESSMGPVHRRSVRPSSLFSEAYLGPTNRVLSGPLVTCSSTDWTN